jgi:hypothetical protein
LDRPAHNSASGQLQKSCGSQFCKRTTAKKATIGTDVSYETAGLFDDFKFGETIQHK